MSANGKFDKFYVGLNLMGVEDNSVQRPISRVTLLLDDENVLTAGDDTGLELTADCPHATQEMVNALLAELKGSRYKMYSSTDAKFDPSAELGDGITVGNIYSCISRIDDDGMGFPSPSAPGKEELEDEYPAGGPMTQFVKRKIGEIRSSITKTSEEIRLQVDDMADRVSSISTKIDSITLSVVNGETSSIIKLMAGGVEIASQNIVMNGLATFQGLEEGTTTINGGCIKTGTIKSINISSSTINGGTITGALIQGGSLVSEGIYSGFTRSTTINDGFIYFHYDGEQNGVVGSEGSGTLIMKAQTGILFSAGKAGYSSAEISGDDITFSHTNNELFHCYNNIDLHNYSILNTSDERLKTNIEPPHVDALSVINAMQTYSFDWRESGKHENLGFIAQQLEKINPDFVNVSPADGHYSTKEMKIIPYLVKAVQELSIKLEKLEGKTV